MIGGYESLQMLNYVIANDIARGSQVLFELQKLVKREGALGFAQFSHHLLKLLVHGLQDSLEDVVYVSSFLQFFKVVFEGRRQHF